MPLYLEILEQDHSASVPTLPDSTDARTLGAWTNETTGETVRLVDSPDAQGSPSATVHLPRILSY